jgi:formylglycine-generating enzyme required for sulfatase activity
MSHLNCPCGNWQKNWLMTILVLGFSLSGCQQIVDRVAGKVRVQKDTVANVETNVIDSQTPPISTNQAKIQDVPVAETVRTKPKSSNVATVTVSKKPLLEVFQDCESCPKMISLPAGSFRMGSPANEVGRHDDESLLFEVNVQAFALAMTEVTRFDWILFERQSGYRAASGCLTWDGDGYVQAAHLGWRNPGFSQSDEHPVVCISWQDAQAYARWLSTKTGHQYRLPSEREWEYAARAGTSTPYPWSGASVCDQANLADEALRLKHPGWPIEECKDGYPFTSPVGSYAPNSFGLYDMHGNVMEWLQDCWSPQLQASDDSPAALNCRSRVIRGGGWDLTASYMRSAYRGKAAEANRGSATGFRLVRKLL